MTRAFLRGRRIGLLAGGGLSSWAVAKLLAEEGADFQVHFADVGQVDETHAQAFLDDMERHRIPCRRHDLRDAAAALALDLVRCRAGYEGGYWNTTGALRLVLLANLAPRLVEAGCDILAHGCVGGGNDQRRFERLTAHYAPGLEVLAPWTDPVLRVRCPDRAGMVRVIEADGPIAGVAGKAAVSSDGSLMGVSHEGTAIEALDRPWRAAPFALSRTPQAAPDETVAVRVGIEGGALATLDGRPQTARGAMEAANALAGRAGVGLTSVIETRIIGTKCRGIYEAPGMTLLGFAYEQLARAVLSPASLALHEELSRVLGRAVYEGRSFEAHAAAARAALVDMTGVLGGEVEVALYKGNLALDGLRNLPADALGAHQHRFAAGGQVWT
ncbi:argininosuccinate synthase domain-containing protein [Arenibaculum sp.]|jgi:argininosuccinate synthase|uniref:argininosuccinate synthase domain-containing protein n=1 Tax=Arenibaculum sp. TaxID=2865862 RepID=UPI002E155D75|nr:argininosuccinate synthase domain-containing protein [Arenibaculum sp.]